MRFVFCVYPTDKARNLAERLKNIAEKENNSTIICELNSDDIDSSIFKDSNAIVSIGGDGTFLKASHFAIEYDIPILGLNAGTLGFLTEAGFAESEEIFSKFLTSE